MDAARADNRRRFELELEFVQSLGNPHYLASLAQQDILSDSAFINYLEYLTYWADPEYARFVVYPHALHHLSLLQHENFREALKSGATEQWLHEKQFDYWRTWRSKAPAISATLDVKTISQQTTTVPLAAGPSSSSGATPLPGVAASTPRPSVSTPRRRATPISTPLPRASTPHAQPASSTPLPPPPRSGSGGGGGQSRRASGTGPPRRTSGVHGDTTKNGTS